MAAKTSTDEVLTPPEAAKYLRISKAALLQLADQGALPGRKIGKEWRFLKEALQDWLRRSPPEGVNGTKSSKEVLLELAGTWKDDPILDDEMLASIYKARGRPMLEEPE